MSESEHCDKWHDGTCPEVPRYYIALGDSFKVKTQLKEEIRKLRRDLADLAKTQRELQEMLNK